MARRLTLWIVIGMFAGIALGAGLHQVLPADSKALTQSADLLKLLPEVFLRLIKMIIAPLILGTLVTGIAAMGDSSALGRIGGRALGWFIASSLVSIGMGLVLVNLFQPGHGLQFTAVSQVGALSTADFTVRHFILEIVPTSVIGAMAENNVLQILVFSLFAGVALSALGDKGAPLLRGAEALVDLMLVMTGYVMMAAPLAVFGALASVIATRGLGIVITYGEFVAEFYGGLALFCALLLALAWAFMGRRAGLLLRYIREPLLLAYSTASSESALPRLFEALDRYGVPRRISGFVLPLGYSFNLVGSMIYCTFATIFIAQALGTHLTLWNQLVIIGVAMLTSKGASGVTGAGFITLAATLSVVSPALVPGIAIVFGIDKFMSECRALTNITGNGVACVVVSWWEGELDRKKLREALNPKAYPPEISAIPAAVKL